MIVADIKPIEEITLSIRGYRNIWMTGCGSCVSVCLSGGDREARMLARELARVSDREGRGRSVSVETILRQCELDIIQTYHRIPEGTDAVVSLACGAGVQTMADAFDPIPVIPAVNTTFMGATFQSGVWEEMCRGCGNCVLTDTAGLCPVARCAKGLMHGPCGGTNGKSCEVSPDIPCVWVRIIDRLGRQAKLAALRQLDSPKDWRPGGGSGPRVRKRTGIAGSPGGPGGNDE